MRKISPVTPGELLLEEFLKPMVVTRYRLAKEIGVPQRRIGEIVAGKRKITADTDLRLARYFGVSAIRYANGARNHGGSPFPHSFAATRQPTPT